MRTLIATALALLIASPAFAAEPDGCDKFKWPIESDRMALKATDRVTMESGGALSISAKAFTLALKPVEAAALPMPPEKSRGAGNFAGFLKMPAPEKPGSYTVSMSSAVWIDVIQDGRFLKPAAFSGATGCDGIRKTMRFDLAAQPFIVQASGNAEPSVALLVRPSD